MHAMRKQRERENDNTQDQPLFTITNELNTKYAHNKIEHFRLVLTSHTIHNVVVYTVCTQRNPKLFSSQRKKKKKNQKETRKAPNGIKKVSIVATKASKRRSTESTLYLYVQDSGYFLYLYSCETVSWYFVEKASCHIYYFRAVAIAIYLCESIFRCDVHERACRKRK